MASKRILSLFKWSIIVYICINFVRVSNAFAHASCSAVFADGNGREIQIVTREEIKGSDSNDAHEILGISQDASPSEIKSRYRALAQRFHPDKAEGSGEKFLKIKEAYERLTMDPNYQLFEKSKDVFGLLDALIFDRETINEDGKVDFLKVFYSELTGSYPLLHTLPETPAMYARAAKFKTLLSKYMETHVAEMSDSEFNRLADFVAERLDLWNPPLPSSRSIKTRDAMREYMKLEERYKRFDIENTVLLYAFYSSPRSLKRPEILWKLAGIDMARNQDHYRGKITVFAALTQPYMSTSKLAWSVAAEVLPGLRDELIFADTEGAFACRAFGEAIQHSPGWQKGLKESEGFANAFHRLGDQYFRKLMKARDGKKQAVDSPLVSTWIQWPRRDSSFLQGIEWDYPGFLEKYYPDLHR